MEGSEPLNNPEKSEPSDANGHILDELRAGGRVVDSGKFTLDPGAENQKLLGQLQYPEGALGDKVFELTFQHLDPFLQQLDLARQSVTEEFSTNPEARQREQERREKFLEEAAPLAQPWADALGQLIPRLSKRLKSALGHLHKTEPTYFTDSGEEHAVVLFSDKLAEFRHLVRERHLSRGLWYAGAAQSFAPYRTSWHLPWDATPRRYASEVAERAHQLGLSLELLKVLIENPVLDHFVDERGKVPRVRRYSAKTEGMPTSEILFTLVQKGIGVSEYGEQMLEHPAFKDRSGASREQVRFVGLDFTNLKLESGAYWRDVDAVRHQLGLDRCLAGDAVALLLHTPPHLLKVRTGIVVFSDRLSSENPAYPTVHHLDLFMITRGRNRPGLGHRRVDPGYGFYPGHEFVFRLRNV